MAMNYNPYPNPYPVGYPQQMLDPMAPYQSRLAQMQQQFQQPQVTQPIPAQHEQSALCRPVASMDEAKAVPTDFNGNLMVFTDISHGAIYTKQLNYQDGSAMFRSYKLVPEQLQPALAEPTQIEPKVEYAPMSEITALHEEINQLRGLLELQDKAKPVKGGVDK